MKKYGVETIESKVLLDVICDCCGKSCRKENDFEYASLWAEWGYGSRKDGDVWDLDLCEDCAGLVMEYVNSWVGK